MSAVICGLSSVTVDIRCTAETTSAPSSADSIAASWQQETISAPEKPELCCTSHGSKVSSAAVDSPMRRSSNRNICSRDAASGGFTYIYRYICGEYKYGESKIVSFNIPCDRVCLASRVQRRVGRADWWRQRLSPGWSSTGKTAIVIHTYTSAMS